MPRSDAVDSIDTGADALLTSPLHDAHVALGATLAPFGGWQMPISYAGSGVVAEHTAVREAVGLFDVSHLGKATVTGPGAAAFVNRCLSADLARIAPGQAQYTLCCNDSGGVIDDLIAYLVSADEVFLVPNAANTAAVVAALQAAAPDGIEVVDRHREFGVLAVQGPRSAEVLDGLGLPSELDYMAWADADFAGSPVRVCRTGYTGEHGYELLPTWNGSPALWDALLDAVQSHGGRAAGLGARRGGAIRFATQPVLGLESRRRAHRPCVRGQLRASVAGHARLQHLRAVSSTRRSSSRCSLPTNAIDDLALPLYGEGAAVRDFVYVEDHCRAIDLVLHEAPLWGGVYNIGTGHETSGKQVADAVLDILEKPRSLIEFVANQPGHDYRYAVDIR